MRRFRVARTRWWGRGRGKWGWSGEGGPKPTGWKVGQTETEGRQNGSFVCRCLGHRMVGSSSAAGRPISYDGRALRQICSELLIPRRPPPTTLVVNFAPLSFALPAALHCTASIDQQQLQHL
ncbi:hypothetical protein M758_5G163000 [Ceratodon purpureus]|nr:hypothetical protein M758_5G163000 [Ceratodon purpureus]